MAMMVAVGGALGVYTLWRWLYELSSHRRVKRLRRRMGAAVTVTVDRETADDLDQPLFDRVVKPFLNRWQRWLTDRIIPSRIRKEIHRQLRAAGMAVSPEGFLFVRIGVTVLLFALGMVLVSAVVPFNLGERVALPLALGLIGYVYVGVHVKTRAQRRMQDLDRRLPEVFDFLSVSVEAGLAFDGALRRLVGKTQGVVHDEFGRVLSDIQVGFTREEALRALAERTRLAELTRFASLVAQSERTGGGIAQILKVQGRRLKEMRVFRAREQAAQLPVKLLFPLVLFIFPTLFVVIVGPGAMSIMKVFGHH